MEDSDIIFLGSHERGLAPHVTGQHDRNNTDLIGASTSNGIRISQMNNRNTLGSSSRQDNTQDPPEMHVGIFDNMLRSINNHEMIGSINNHRLASQINQANGHQDNNNYMHLTGAPISNGIQSSQMNNRNPPGTSSSQSYMHPPSGVHVDSFENMSQPIDFQQLSDSINNRRIAAQATGQCHRNNNIDLIGASTSNGNQNLHLNNRYPHCTSSLQNNMHLHSEKTEEKMLQGINFQQLYKSTASVEHCHTLNRSSPYLGEMSEGPCSMITAPPRDRYERQATAYPSTNDFLYSALQESRDNRCSPAVLAVVGEPPMAPPRDRYERLVAYPSTNDSLYSALHESRDNSLRSRIYFSSLAKNSSTYCTAQGRAVTSTPDSSYNPHPNLIITEPAASSSGRQPKPLNKTPNGSRKRHEPYMEPVEPIARRINPPRKAKTGPEAAIGTDGANHVPTKPAKRSASVPSSKAKGKSQVGRPRKVQKVAEPHPMIPDVAQEESSYQHLLDLNAADLVTTTEDDHCPGCLVWVLAGDGVVLKDCLHTFCRVCLHNAILHSETAQVRCPFASEEYVCESHLQEREIKCLVSAGEYEQLLTRSVSQAQSKPSNAFHCRMPGCTGWCLFEGGVREFLCSVCGHTNCLTCWEIHEGTECKEHMRSMFTQATETAPQSSKGVEPISEEAQNYQSLLVLNDMGLVTNKERFDCPICFSEVEVGEGVTLKDCLHNYCRECLAGTIHHSETVLVKCPFANEDYSCESYLQEREIKWLVTPDEYERHLARSMALVESQAQNSFHCKTPDCPGWCLFEDDVNWFFCEVCSQTNCLTCAAIHLGKNCKQYQDWLAFESDTSEDARKTREYLKKQVESNRAMECPTCNVIVMKRDGCDYLRCSMCRTEICWATRGPRWGPNGRGDTSGGCKCDWQNRNPCHPKCNNCH